MAQKRPSPSKGSRGKYHIEMSSLSLFFWGFCLCFLLAWVFVLGVLVGRGFLPSAVSTISDLKSQVSRLQGLVPQAKPPAPESPKIENDPKLAFYEKLSSKKEEVKKKGPQEEKQPPAVKATPERKEQPPSPVPKPVEKPANGPGNTQYTVQLAAVEDRAKAEAMVARLKGGGFEAYFSEVKIKGKTFYRIRCGKFKTKEEAAAHARRLADGAGIQGFVSKFE
jgi:cell division septation protein DedD